MKKADLILFLQEIMISSPKVNTASEGKIVFFSDLHLGDGSGQDEGIRNEALLQTALERFYYDRGYSLILNGDVEELFKFEFQDIVKAHPRMYETFDRFNVKGKFWKLIGNHDLSLLALSQLPWPLNHSLRIEDEEGVLLAFHGHQSSSFYIQYHSMSDFLVRYLAHPLRIKNLDRPMTNKRRLGTERRIYQASRALRIASITGHTHRPLFESLGTYDYLRFSLERLIGEYGTASVEQREILERKIRFHAEEIRRMAGRNKRKTGRSLYDRDGVPVPCLFNSGSTIGKHGITALELENGVISLVLWARPGSLKPWIDSETSGLFSLYPETRTKYGDEAARYIIRQESLSSVFTRIRLLA